MTRSDWLLYPMIKADLKYQSRFLSEQVYYLLSF
ncbi:hypothetical protein BDD43_3922 [Mucilaginibacter gracilis]|uniref:Uncharacterized protein n=1 Tax=Mucilaginibacter gracilis TaxID=423350 RepID=A0A495J5L0_9SPHI|nr:hypothetical protein BDD43_3922 [Mucilaginibacter gracilis]